MALPTPHDAQAPDGQQLSFQSSSFAAVMAAADTVADFKGFCERRPQACVTGQYLAYSFESKAKYLMRLAYSWSAPANPNAEQLAEVQVGTVGKAPAKSGAPALRLTTFSEVKPASIDDLLSGSAQ